MIVHMERLGGNNRLWTACGKRWARKSPTGILVRLSVVDDWSLVTCRNCLKAKPK